MQSVNKAIIMGNVGQEPRAVGQGCSFSVATSDTWKDRQTGERKERTEWHSVTIWNPNLAQIALTYVKKGSKVYVEGALQTRQFEQDGVKKYATDIVLSQFNGQLVLLDARQEGENPSPTPQPHAEPALDLNDEIPF